MKIVAPGIGGPSAIRPTRDTKGRGASKFAHEMPMAGSAAPRALSASGFVPPADLILAQHDEDDAARERRQAVNQGQLLLDRLEGIRLAILSGRLSRAEIEALARAVSQPRQIRADPALASLLDEIALRAAVEIAKLEQVEKTRY